MRVASLILCIAATPALAGESWDAVRAELWGDRPIASGDGALALLAPARAADDRRVPVAAEIAFADGRRVKSVTLIIDENPMPVSAAFDLAEPSASLTVGASLRLNGPSPVRAVVEDDRGGLTMAETMVKTSGLGACAAPPTTDAAVAMATLGRMALADDPAAALRAAADPAAAPVARLEISHPQHSGMQMDQITLLYTPARWIEAVEIAADGAPLMTVRGSISLSENPEISFTTPAGADALRVRLTDTEGAVFERAFGLGAS